MTLREELLELTTTIRLDLVKRAHAGEARDAGTNLIRACALLLLAEESALNEGNRPILLAKEACEELIDRAKRAIQGGDKQFAKVLYEHVRNLSPIVARLHSELKPDKDKSPEESKE